MFFGSQRAQINCYFIKNMNISKVIEVIRIYRSFELDSDHYLSWEKQISHLDG